MTLLLLKLAGLLMAPVLIKEIALRFYPHAMRTRKAFYPAMKSLAMALVFVLFGGAKFIYLQYPAPDYYHVVSAIVLLNAGKTYLVAAALQAVLVKLSPQPRPLAANIQFWLLHIGIIASLSLQLTAPDLTDPLGAGDVQFIADLARPVQLGQTLIVVSYVYMFALLVWAFVARRRARKTDLL